jgi:hypothetical protein
MAGRDGKKHARSANVGRRMLVGMGAGAGVFFAAAAMATGSAAPAKADFEDLLDPIIQPILTSLTDSLAGFDPTAAADLTSWTDSLLASLNSIDLAAPAASESAASAAVPASDASGTYDIPITIQEDTEPTVQATVGGADTTLLVDTGSSGLVVPYTDFGSTFTQQFDNILALGFPTGISTSGYSGGVEYLYLEYNDVSTDYGNGILDTTGPVDVEIYSYNPSDLLSLFSNNAFQTFDQDNDVTGILGVGDGVGPNTEGPFQADGFNGVTVDLPANGLVVGANAGDPVTTISDSASGAPITALYESVNGGTPTAVSDDLDSGGVYGTIPQSLVGSDTSVPSGTTISVYDNAAGTGTPLYTYTTTIDSDMTSTSPEITTGTNIDSGVIPFEEEPIYIDYTNDSLTFDSP